LAGEERMGHKTNKFFPPLIIDCQKLWPPYLTLPYLTLPYLTFQVNSLKDRLLSAEAILMLAHCASPM